MEIRFELVKFSRKKLNVEKGVVARKVLVSKDGMALDVESLQKQKETLFLMKEVEETA